MQRNDTRETAATAHSLFAIALGMALSVPLFLLLAAATLFRF